jgi:hypothetical protein
MDAAFAGRWTAQIGVAPRGTSLVTVIARGSVVSPSMVEDSTFDLGHFAFSGHGTHLKVKMISGIAATAAKLGKIVVLYNPAERK